jgi:periplasmic glucans biosynthesis protein
VDAAFAQPGVSDSGIDATADRPFTSSTVRDIARALGQLPFVPPPKELPHPIEDLTYEQYRDIWFDHRKAIWARENLPFQVEMFHRGFYYKEEIEVAIVEDGQARHLRYSPDYYDFGARLPKPMPTEDIGFAGIRLHARMGEADRFGEFAVFLGASYFRSLGKGQAYGLSARGLALKTGAPEGEEFPLFRAFWVEKPLPESESIVVHALLDSVSVVGAYRFSIRPGTTTMMDVEATLFPRVELAKLGLAPGTSMFFFGPGNREGVDDWRPEVHDSDGLLMVNGRGERLWRPLANPSTLQVSAFVDAAPRGFGLMQRNRDLDAYQDFEARYERRPSLWTEMVGDWGRGAVVLVEISSDSEIHDNIVAFWQPDEPIAGGSELSIAYRLFWGNQPAPAGGGPMVQATRGGQLPLRGESSARRFVIDYAVPQAVPAGAAVPTTHISASEGTVANVTIKANPLTGGWRLTFDLDPEDADVIELRAEVQFHGNPPSEVWLYRWAV